MQNCYIKVKSLERDEYSDDGEFWVTIEDFPQAFLVDESSLVTDSDLENDFITPDEITGVLGQLLDEVDLPEDIHEQVMDLYKRAAKALDMKEE